MKIDEIKDGVVFDHIRAGLGMEIYNALALRNYDGQVALIQNAKSIMMGRKDVLKIASSAPAFDLDKVAYIDPNVTVNFIRGGKLIEKKKLSLPQTVRGIVKCKNPRCITNHENVESVFVLTDANNGVYRCLYWESTA